MKKVIFLLILLAAFSNFSYASFPVNEKEIILNFENLEVPVYDEEKKIWGNLSFYSSILSLIVLPNFSSLVLSILSIVFGIIGLTKKVNWKVVTGLIIGFVSAIIFALFFALIILSGGTGAAFGG
ncbi:hypothetical protein OAQ16_03305 [Flavobacteriales bacterium]|nr:hypothetical protein [Flavobacteriales bacterium]